MRGTRDGVACLAGVQRTVDDLPLRRQRGRRGVHRGRPGPGRGEDAVHRLVRDLHHAGDETNAAAARTWLVQELRADAAGGRRFAAMSTNTGNATAFGIDPVHVFGFWDWVGGR